MMRFITSFLAIFLLAGCVKMLTPEESAALTPEEIAAENARREVINNELRSVGVQSAIRTIRLWNAKGIDFVQATAEQQAYLSATCVTLTTVIDLVQLRKEAVGDTVKYPGLTEDVLATCEVAITAAGGPET